MNQNKNGLRDDERFKAKDDFQAKAAEKKTGRSGRGKRQQGKDGKQGRTGKKFEVNLPDKDLNKADLSGFGLRDGTSGKNDPSFWNKFPSIAENAARIPFNTRLGSPTPLDFKESGGTRYNFTANNNNALAQPGLMVMRFIPTVGKCVDQLSPLNTLLTSSYAWFRTHYRAAARYEPADIGLYLVSVSSGCMMWAEVSRLIGLVRAVKARNLYTAQALVRALGYSYTSISQNLADLEQKLNVFASQLRRWPIPNNLSVVSRWVQLSSNVYKDAPGELAQMYVWQTEGYYQYIEGTDSGSPAGYCKYIKFNQLTGAKTTPDQVMGVGHPLVMTFDDQGLMTYEGISQILDSLLMPLFGSSSMAQIASDISSAVGEQNMFAVPDIGYNFTVEYKYEPEEQEQIENAHFVGDMGTPVHNLDITQAIPVPSANSPSYLVQNVLSTTTKPLAADSYTAPLFVNHTKFLNSHAESVTTDSILVNTRMMPTGLFSADASSITLTLEDYGTEVPTIFYPVVLAYNGVSYNFPVSMGAYPSTSAITTRVIPISTTNETEGNYYAGQTEWLSSMASLLASFDWHPIVYLYNGLGDAAPLRWQNPILDFDNYAVVSDDMLSKLHDAAVMSAFYLDQVTYYKP